jgi:hypothetical protein
VSGVRFRPGFNRVDGWNIARTPSEGGRIQLVYPNSKRIFAPSGCTSRTSAAPDLGGEVAPRFLGRLVDYAACFVMPAAFVLRGGLRVFGQRPRTGVILLRPAAPER